MINSSAHDFVASETSSIDSSSSSLHVDENPVISESDPFNIPEPSKQPGKFKFTIPITYHGQPCITVQPATPEPREPQESSTHQMFRHPSADSPLPAGNHGHSSSITSAPMFKSPFTINIGSPLPNFITTLSTPAPHSSPNPQEVGELHSATTDRLSRHLKPSPLPLRLRSPNATSPSSSISSSFKQPSLPTPPPGQLMQQMCGGQTPSPLPSPDTGISPSMGRSPIATSPMSIARSPLSISSITASQRVIATNPYQPSPLHGYSIAVPPVASGNTMPQPLWSQQPPLHSSQQPSLHSPQQYTTIIPTSAIDLPDTTSTTPYNDTAGKTNMPMPATQSFWTPQTPILQYFAVLNPDGSRQIFAASAQGLYPLPNVNPDMFHQTGPGIPCIIDTRTGNVVQVFTAGAEMSPEMFASNVGNRNVVPAIPNAMGSHIPFAFAETQQPSINVHVSKGEQLGPYRNMVGSINNERALPVKRSFYESSEGPSVARDQDDARPKRLKPKIGLCDACGRKDARLLASVGRGSNTPTFLCINPRTQEYYSVCTGCWDKVKNRHSGCSMWIHRQLEAANPGTVHKYRSLIREKGEDSPEYKEFSELYNQQLHIYLKTRNLASTHILLNLRKMTKMAMNGMRYDKHTTITHPEYASTYSTHTSASTTTPQPSNATTTTATVPNTDSLQSLQASPSSHLPLSASSHHQDRQEQGSADATLFTGNNAGALSDLSSSSDSGDDDDDIISSHDASTAVVGSTTTAAGVADSTPIVEVAAILASLDGSSFVNNNNSENNNHHSNGTSASSTTMRKQ